MNRSSITRAVELFGRGITIPRSAQAPDIWQSAETLAVDVGVLAKPEYIAKRLYTAWLSRKPVVVRLEVDLAALKRPETWHIEPYELRPDFTPWRDVLYHFVFCNNYRMLADGEIRWPWAEAAVARAGARDLEAGVDGDILAPKSGPAWIDGGPREPLDAAHIPISVIHWESIESGLLTVVPPAVEPTTSLAADQAQAVTHERGSARIIAPAGSGKTRVLTARLRHLIVDRGYETQKVVAVAYNKRAQQEMQSRCTDFRPRIRTLNSLGLEITKSARGQVDTIDDGRVREILQPLIESPERRLNTDPFQPYMDALSAVRKKLTSPEAMFEDSDEIPGFNIVFPKYRQRLRQLDAVDFDEQIYAAVEALLQNGALRRSWQSQCRHLLIDEFQDLTPLHLLFLRLLATPSFQVFGVGDDDQVLYEYEGATPEFLINFKKYFPGAAQYALETNYRCPVAIVKSATYLLDINLVRERKTIQAGDGAETDPTTISSRKLEPDKMVDGLMSVVGQWLDAGVKPKDIAILTRINALLLAPHIYLTQKGIIVNSTLGPWLLDRTGARVALAYLRLACSPGAMRAIDLELVFRRPRRNIPYAFRDAVMRHTVWTLDDLRTFDKQAGGLPGLPRFTDELELLARLAQTAPTRQVLVAIRTTIGVGAVAAKLDQGKSGAELDGHTDDLQALEEVSSLYLEPATFESWLRTSFRASENPDGIVLATVHKVKGQEWDHVIIYGASQDVMPHRLSREQIEGERRVMHVAVTRARRKVVLLSDVQRPSQFLDELNGTARKTAPVVRPPTFASPPRYKLRGITVDIGETVKAGGLTGSVLNSTPRGIRLRVGSATLLVRWGEPIEVDGRRGELLKC